jgi:predicted SAM-dependent methyltransferase
MRPCPVCEDKERTAVFKMDYAIPDNWPLPSYIVWYTCNNCGMIYGDGEFNQDMLNDYYQHYYGYGIYHPDNTERLLKDAERIAKVTNPSSVIVDFGGSGDDGHSVLVNMLKSCGRPLSTCIGAGDGLPSAANVIYASHVLEHVYELPETMREIFHSLADGGTLIVDVPDSFGLLVRWKMPILDFNTKHINHFTMRTLLELGRHYNFEAVYVKQYELEVAPCLQVHFKRVDVATESAKHIRGNINERIAKLKNITFPVNIWGVSDIVWHILSQTDLSVINYIDSDPAYRNRTYKGKTVLERPDNDAPIVILAQGSRERLIEYIKQTGVKNRIIEI